jgi:ABC-type polar amino acid transport system ATPase subunit
VQADDASEVILSIPAIDPDKELIEGPDEQEAQEAVDELQDELDVVVQDFQNKDHLVIQDQIMQAPKAVEIDDQVQDDLNSKSRTLTENSRVQSNK